MNRKFGYRLKLLQIAAFGAAAGAVLCALPAYAQNGRDEVAALATLQPGQWSLRGRDATTPSKSICIHDMRALLQIEHGKAQCGRFVITDQPTVATVHYTCPGAGHGQTTLRVETSRLVQIDSQGVIGNEPFAVTYEGRRIGECQALAAAYGRQH